MTDQKLVDELEKALRDEAYDGGMGALSPEEFTDYVRGLAVTAAKVVAEAHTPTDDEREALDYAIRCAIPNDLDYRPLWKLIRAIQDAVLAAGFRRSEARRIVDSSDGPAITQEAIDLLDAMNAEGRIFHADYSRLHDLISMSQPQGEPSSIPFYDEKMRELAEIGAQGEPSDAVIRDHGGWDMGLQSKPYPPDSVVDAALSAWNGTGGSDRVAMRAALRAAGGAR